MKKIVMGIAALAMAASIFAADVSINFKGIGNLFDMQFTDGAKPQFLGWNDPWDQEYSWSSTGLGFAYYGDKAGCSFEFDNRDVTVKASKFWLQPVDMFKITLGSNEVALPKEQIDWDGTVFVSDYEGWLFSVTPIKGLAIDLGLGTNQPNGWSCNYWYGAKNYGAATMGEIVADASYTIDNVGTFKAVYDYNDKVNTIGLDYAGAFGNVTVSPAVAYKFDGDTVNAIAADFYGTVGIDSLAIAAYAKADYDLAASSDALAILAKAKFSYALDFGTAFFYVKDANVMAKQFAMTVEPGIDFNVGSASLEVAAKLDIGSTTELSIPFSYKVSF